MAYLIEDQSFPDAERSGSGAAVENEVIALVTQAQLGDIRAFEALYELYNNQISRYLSRMVGNDGVGCELTQETFVKVWTYLPGLRSPTHFLGWLYRIATNCAYTYLKKHARHKKELSLEIYLEQSDDLYIEGPEKRVEELELLRMALEKVSPTYRPCLILHLIEDLPQNKIAELLGMKETSVSKYVSRGLKDLRQIYRKYVDTYSKPGMGGKAQ
ncbi:DNA-directed RNA polymerase sigma-70 factor [Ktedonobacter sp. SOSP1-85]|uniref:RNA polymerase sigma factor n=1 Tax=Ktedonobacter sp. SOSP1-85 TaxID=2778367 RepID=UPI00191679C4|nr:RNA polymerase sigma factor [Ktedonobacter sp. SOSP1-85]GHO80589.1 DNA-directed RNA polymerase sigma-70 factor [Ktedonobacter sp. SOSP1-85]